MSPGLRFLMPVVYGGGACALPRLVAWARRATQYRRATGHFPDGGRRRTLRGADASHLNARNTLYIRNIQPPRDLIDSMAR